VGGMDEPDVCISTGPPVGGGLGSTEVPAVGGSEPFCIWTVKLEKGWGPAIPSSAPHGREEVVPPRNVTITEEPSGAAYSATSPGTRTFSRKVFPFRPIVREA